MTRSILLVIATLLPTPVASAQQPAADSASAPLASTITGRVVNETGQPLAGATVYVQVIGLLQRTVGTDNEGNFKAEALEPGVYRIWTSAPGYVAEPVVPEAPRKYYRVGDSVTLTLLKGGVVTGKIVNASDEPVVAVNVRAFRVRDENGKPVARLGQARERLTDDRGIYRLFGLAAGTYVVSAGGASQFGNFGQFGFSRYDRDSATYSPSSTRDAAAEITVRWGEESNADIRYRGEPGHSVSGKLAGALPAPPMGTSVTIEDSQTGAVVSMASVPGESQSFELNGVADGEYVLVARGSTVDRQATVSPPRPVSVKGGDVIGVELVLAPLASIAGRVVIESDSQANCVRRRATAVRETLVSVRRQPTESERKAAKEPKKAPAYEALWTVMSSSSEAAPDDKGEFKLNNLNAGLYRIETRLPGSGWFVRSIVTGAAPQKTSTAAPVATSIAREGITIASGDRVSNLIVTIAEGAAAFRGRVALKEGEKLPSDLRVYLTPAERERAGDVLRFAESPVDSDGTFAIGNIAPGRYRAMVRPAFSNDSKLPLPIALQDAGRTNLLREAESSGVAIELRPCERIADYELRYVVRPAASPTNPATRAPLQ